MENQTADLNDLIEPLRTLTGIDFSMGEDGLPHFDGDLSEDQHNRLYKLGDGLDVIDIDVLPLGDGNQKSYKVTGGHQDVIDYMEKCQTDGTMPDVDDFEATLNQTTVMSGKLDDDPDILEVKRRKRQEQYNSFHQAGAGFGAAAAAATAPANNDKGLDADDEGGNSRTLLGKAGHYFGLGVASCKYGVKAQSDSKGQISDRQLKAMIKIGVLEKGYDTLYFYDRRSKRINPEVSSRAQEMIQRMQIRGELPAAGISVSMKPQDVKPWNYLFRQPAEKWADFKHEFKDRKNKAVDEAVKPVSRTMHNLGWKNPLKDDFAKAHDNKTGRTRTNPADEEVVKEQHAANNMGPGASSA